MKFSTIRKDFLNMSLGFAVMCIAVGIYYQLTKPTSNFVPLLVAVLLTPTFVLEIVAFVELVKYRTEITETAIIQTKYGKVLRELNLDEVTSIFIVVVRGKNSEIVVDNGVYQQEIQKTNHIATNYAHFVATRPLNYYKNRKVPFCVFEYSNKRLKYLQYLLNKNYNKTIQSTDVLD